VGNLTFEVTVSAGSLRSERAGVTMRHRWTPDGVVVEADFTGAHLFLLSAAGCVLNDVYREAQGAGFVVEGVRVNAAGGFDDETWACTGVDYQVDVATPAPEADVERLLRSVDVVAEIPKAMRAGAPVRRLASPRATRLRRSESP
jgi:uncharacterized OsmC-like protein